MKKEKYTGAFYLSSDLKEKFEEVKADYGLTGSALLNVLIAKEFQLIQMRKREKKT